jgi:TolB-like protein
MSLFSELKRRNVFKVAAAYVIVGWLIMQAGEVMGPALNLPGWVNSMLAFFLILGFPLALLFAWAFEMTPDGLKKEKNIDRSQSIAQLTGRKLDFTIIAMLVVALAYFVYEKSSSPVVVEQLTDISTTTEQAIQPSIAVLPFADMSPQGDQAYFSDGIAEELLNLLVGVEGLKVASRTSSFSYKGNDLNLSEIAEELKVGHILEGSVRKAGNRVRITAQLIDAATDRHLWSESYDRDLTDIFLIQDEIANAIVAALRSELGLLETATPIVVKADTDNIDAYQLYLEARGLFLARQDLQRSIDLFEQAVELDANFARAWEGLGAVFSVAEGWGVAGEEFDERSRVAAQRAIDLDPSLSMAWAVFANVTVELDFDYILPMSQFGRALENDPMNATAWLWRGLHYAKLGFAYQAISDISMCIEIDPSYLNCYRHLARVHMARGETDKSLEIYVLMLRKGLTVNDYWLIHPLLSRGKIHAAAFLLIELSNGDRTYPISELMQAAETPGEDHSAGIAKLDQWLKQQGTDPKWRIDEWIALGAYDHVEPVIDINQIWLPSSSGFRKSAWFKPLVNQIGLHRYWREYEFPPRCRPIGEEDFECD